MAGGRLGEYEGVDEGEIEGLHSLLHTVGFFFYFPHSKVLSVLFMKPANSTRERTRERERQRGRQRGRGRESARACVRAAFGALGICTRRNTVRAQGVLSLRALETYEEDTCEGTVCVSRRQ